MKIDIDPEIFSAYQQPFMVLDAKAKMVYANTAAQPFVAMLSANRLLWLRELLKAADSNEAPPHCLPTEGLPPEAKNWNIWFTSTAASEYVLWFTPLTTGVTEKTDDIPGMSLIGQQMRDEMIAYASMLADHFSSLKSSKGVPIHFQLMAKTRQIAERMDELAKLSELYERKPFGKEERIYLYSLINQITSQPPTLTGSPVKWVVDPSGAMLAPIYGDKSLIELALRSYLKKLATSAPGGSAIHIQFQQFGGYASLIGSSQLDLTQLESNNHDTQSAQTQKRADDLSLLLAERVLQLHGAVIKINNLSDKDIFESIRITFPTGYPQTARPDIWCQNCPAAEQSAALARDIATLIQAQKNV